MNVIEENNRINMLTQGTTTAVMTGYFYSAYVAMLPWFAAAIPLILLDLNLGRAKARQRGEEVTLNKSIRMTLDKSFSYICWIMLSTTLSMAFDTMAIKICIMAIVYGLEVVSTVKAWLIVKFKLDVDEKEMLRVICKWIWHKFTGGEEDFKSIIIKHQEKDENSD